jgi:hypothetical protein
MVDDDAEKTTPELEMPPGRRPESWDYGFDKGSNI